MEISLHFQIAKFIYKQIYININMFIYVYITAHIYKTSKYHLKHTN